MRWLMRLLFRGRVRRLEKVQAAAALMSQGRLPEAEAALEACRPKQFLGDVAVFHLVSGRVDMERGRFQKAVENLLVARALGLKQASLPLHLGVACARLGRVEEALAFLTEAREEGEEAIVKQAAVVLDLLEAIRSGKAARFLGEKADIFSKKHLRKPLNEFREAREAVSALEKDLEKASPGHNHKEAAAAVLGEILVRRLGGCWLLGVEVSDHKVLVSGTRLSPSEQIEGFLTQKLESLVPEELIRAGSASVPGR